MTYVIYRQPSRPVVGGRQMTCVQHVIYAKDRQREKRCFYRIIYKGIPIACSILGTLLRWKCDYGLISDVC